MKGATKMKLPEVIDTLERIHEAYKRLRPVDEVEEIEVYINGKPIQKIYANFSTDEGGQEECVDFISNKK